MKLGFLLPSAEILRCVGNVMHELKMHDVYMRVISLDDVPAVMEDVAMMGVDIIVARGIQAYAIRERTTLPVVEIELTGQDMGILIQRAKRQLKKKRPVIGIVGYDNMFCNMQHFEEIFNISLRTYFVDTSSDADTLDKCAQRAAQDPEIDLIIGGETAQKYAADKNVPYIYLDVTEDSIRECMRVVKRISYAIELERQHSARLAALLDYSFNAFAELDERGAIITVNSVAESLLNWERSEVIGRKLTSVVPALAAELLQGVLEGKEEAYSTNLKIDNKEMVVNLAPINVGNEVIGAIFSCQELSRMASSELEKRRLSLPAGNQAHMHFEQMDETSQEMTRFLKQAKVFSKSMSPVLLVHEAGINVECIAQCIHNDSKQVHFPYVEIDCCQQMLLFGGNQMSSELQSIAKAGGGTLFLKNIEELSPQSQYRLRMLLVKKTLIVDGETQYFPALLRVISSTGVNLPERVKEGLFDKELYYYLNVFVLEIPPLRARKSDIAHLLNKLVQKYCNQYGRYIVLTNGAKQYLTEYSWPGNELQLERFCDYMVLSGTRRTIDENLAKRLLAQNNHGSLGEPSASDGSPDAREASKIADALSRNGGKRTATARELGISTSTLWRKIKKYDLQQ